MASYTIIRGKRVAIAGGGDHPEYDSVYLGFSRNGFELSRPPAGQPAGASGCGLEEGRRRPFASMAPKQRLGSGAHNTSWNYGSVQSVTGSPVLAPDNTTLLFYFGGQRGFSASCVGPGSQTGVARLRRDGFAALETTAAGGGGTVTTRRLTTAAGRSELFVNCNGTLSVEVLSGTGVVLLGPSSTASGDGITVQLSWPGKQRPLLPFAGRQPMRFRFTLGPSTRLFAFWYAP